MQVTRTGLVFLSGCAVYALMSACSGNPTTSTSSTSTSTGGPGGAGPASGAGGNTGGAGAATSTSGSGGGGAAPGGKTTSGSRLKRMFDLGDDGTADLELTWIPWLMPNVSYTMQLKPTTRWWDAQRQEACAFKLAADNVMRCLPIDTDSAFLGAVVYYDSKCAQPAVAAQAVQPGCMQPSPKYAIAYDTPVCEPATGMPPLHVSSVGALLGTSNCYFSGPSCQQGCGNSPFVFYAIDAEIPPTSFVAGTPAKDP